LCFLKPSDLLFSLEHAQFGIATIKTKIRTTTRLATLHSSRSFFSSGECCLNFDAVIIGIKEEPVDNANLTAMTNRALNFNA
jgi:hypothetical protein